MIKIRFLFLGLLFSLALSIVAQDKPAILLQIGNENIEAEEFWTIYKKNSQIGSQSEKTSLKEYLDLYINFKLKVMEAKETKMDTAKAFREELAGYRKQLVQPYLVVEKVDDETVKQLYDRMQYNVRASHILLRLPNENSENDTMLTYQKGMRIRAEIEAGKLYFTEAAIKYSEDPSVKDNKGNLGYFSAFRMVYQFENQR